MDSNLVPALQKVTLSNCDKLHLITKPRLSSLPPGKPDSQTVAGEEERSVTLPASQRDGWIPVIKTHFNISGQVSDSYKELVETWEGKLPRRSEDVQALMREGSGSEERWLKGGSGSSRPGLPLLFSYYLSICIGLPPFPRCLWFTTSRRTKVRG